MPNNQFGVSKYIVPINNNPNCQNKVKNNEKTAIFTHNNTLSTIRPQKRALSAILSQQSAQKSLFVCSRRRFAGMAQDYFAPYLRKIRAASVFTTLNARDNALFP